MNNRLRLAFSRDKVQGPLADDLHAELSALKPDDLLARADRATSNLVDKLRSSETRLEGEIAQRTEELRQVRVVIGAQLAAGEILAAGHLAGAV